MSDRVRAPHTKAARQARIEELLAGERIGSQQELAQALAAEGFSVTQGTLSRDLVDVGAIKVRNADGEVVYVVSSGDQGGRSASRARLAQLCADMLLSAVASANLVIVKTPIGAAQYLASSIDKAGFDEVLGTIAGDDTILLVSRDASGGAALAGMLLQLSGRDE